MSYTVDKLAKLSGVSARTLRYYDQLGLLTPRRDEGNGYRLYGREQVDRLQQILFYRELGVPLEDIRRLLSSAAFDRRGALEGHLKALIERRERLDALIGNVRRTLTTMRGETTMTDREKFEGFKQSIVDENERTYGKELRGRFGDEAIDASNKKIKGMSDTDWQRYKELEAQIAAHIKSAAEGGDPACAEAQKACELHAEWLKMLWKNGAYSKGAQLALGQSYVADERFKAYYDAITPGGAEFFLKALEIYCN